MSPVLLIALLIIGLVFNRLAEKQVVENLEERAFRSPHNQALETKKKIGWVKLAYRIHLASLFVLFLFAILT